MRENEIILVTGVGTIIAIVCSALVICLYVFRNLKLKRTQEILRSEIEIHEQSFENISNEIHDNIGQVLSLAKLILNTVESDLTDEKSKKIRMSKDLVGQSIADLRTLSKNLNAATVTEIGLSEAIKRELAMLSKNGQYETSFDQEGKTLRFGSQKELVIFRIFQQVVHKAITQPDMKTLKVQATYEPGRFSLAVHDDGKAGKMPVRPRTSHFRRNKENMFTRASLIGAELSIRSNMEKGNTMFFTLDLAKNN